MMDNQNWLADYVQTGSDAAFRELVTRYVDLVYSTALRLVGGDTHRAEDVAQTVFVNLARVARTLPKEVKLGGWLHRDTCFTASTLMRGERRRQSRERQAVEMNALQTNSEADYSLVALVLDEAINELEEADRTAVLLRFFEQHDFRSVGQALGSNEDAARMRVTRALEKLEGFLKRRGITTTAASLGVVLSANAVQAAPVGLALAISTAAALTGTALATTATVTATKAIAMTAFQKTIITATIAVLAGTGIYVARQASQLREQVQTLQQRQATLAQQSQQFIGERDEATRQLGALVGENDHRNLNTIELLGLRGQVTRLKADSQELLLLKGYSSETTNDPMAASLDKWLSRRKEFQSHIEKMPDTRIPEFQFLSERDWLDVTRDAKLETNEDIGVAAADLKARAKTQFVSLMIVALKKFIAANAGTLPTQLAELKPFFTVPVGDQVLERYELLRSGNVNDVPVSDRKSVLVSEKKSAAGSSTPVTIQIRTVLTDRYGNLLLY
jgi:RNA polymerase sigma factor (sigma-70 family)